MVSHRHASPFDASLLACVATRQCELDQFGVANGADEKREHKAHGGAEDPERNG